jgi:hypothetical protein
MDPVLGDSVMIGREYYGTDTYLILELRTVLYTRPASR